LTSDRVDPLQSSCVAYDSILSFGVSDFLLFSDALNDLSSPAAPKTQPQANAKHAKYRTHSGVLSGIAKVGIMEPANTTISRNFRIFTIRGSS